jgi:uroporphyrinogen-III synthase
MPSPKYILITRPAEESRVFARKLKQEGLQPMIEPMLEIEYLSFEVPALENYEGLVFTSMNAVRALATKLGSKLANMECPPCYCVGDRTAKEARKLGFPKAYSAKGTAGDLVDMLGQKIIDRSKPLLYVRGEHTAQPVDKMIRELGFRVVSVTVYTARAVTKLSPQCLEAIRNKEIGAITFFSKRTAETFLREVKKNGLLQEFFGAKLLSLSDSMIECVRPYRKARTYTAKTPDAFGMMRLVLGLFK